MDNGKTPDSKADTLLRQLLAALKFKGGLEETFKGIQNAANSARWYLEEKDSCEFIEEWGVGCRSAAVRVSHGIPCCEEHARRRDRSF